MSRLDELFGEASAEVKPKTNQAYALVAGGLVAALLGLACTSVPGVLVVLVGWYVADQETDRLDSGFIPQTFAAEVHRAERLARFGVGAAVVIIFAQVMLFCGGFYRTYVEALLLLAMPDAPPA
jgi:hypothetical protein